MGSDRLEAYRITDFVIPMKIMSNPVLSETIYEDGISACIPNVVGEYWVGVRIKGLTFACFQVNQLTSVMWQAHIRILPKYRQKYSRNATFTALKWAEKNIHGLKTLICTVPKCHRDVSLFVRRIGFSFCGTIQEGYVKNNILVGVDIFSINIDKIRTLEI